MNRAILVLVVAAAVVCAEEAAAKVAQQRAESARLMALVPADLRPAEPEVLDDAWSWWRDAVAHCPKRIPSDLRTIYIDAMSSRNPYPSGDEADALDAWLAGLEPALVSLRRGALCDGIRRSVETDSGMGGLPTGALKLLYEGEYLVAKRALAKSDPATAAGHLGTLLKMGRLYVLAATGSIDVIVGCAIFQKAEVLCGTLLRLDGAASGSEALIRYLDPPLPPADEVLRRTAIGALSNMIALLPETGDAWATAVYTTRMRIAGLQGELAQDGLVPPAQPLTNDPTLTALLDHPKLVDREASMALLSEWLREIRDANKDGSRALTAAIEGGLAARLRDQHGRAGQRLLDMGLSGLLSGLTGGRGAEDPPVDPATERREGEQLNQLIAGSNPLGRASVMMILEAQPMVAKNLVRTQARRNLLILALSCHVHRFRTGRLPPSLQSLLDDGLFANLPTDPYSGAALRYDPDRSLLWSIGPDGTDDGGKPPARGGQAKTGEDEVFELAAAAP